MHCTAVPCCRVLTLSVSYALLPLIFTFLALFAKNGLKHENDFSATDRKTCQENLSSDCENHHPLIFNIFIVFARNRPRNAGDTREQVSWVAQQLRQWLTLRVKQTKLTEC